MSARPDDPAWMRRALALARRARGDVGHYPMVGAVVVKQGRVIGEGYFHRPGQPHAEVHALNKAGAKARGADLILNLEPCSHFGTTPPCADAVIAAGVRRVVAGMTDPNPLVAGRGFKKLTAAGIEVVRGVLEHECRELNRVFIKYITTRRPYVFIKAALTLDGNLATASGDAKWISSEPSRRIVHQLRDEVQAVMVGAQTVRADNPELTARLAGKGRHPRPVIVTTDLDVPANAKVIQTPAAGGALLFCTRRASAERVNILRKLGAEVVVVKADRAGHADLAEVMRELGERKIASVLIEGGARLINSALRAGIGDELIFFYAPKLLAGDGARIAAGAGPARIADCLPVTNLQCRKVGQDVMITGRLSPPASGKKKRTCSPD
jgi:diaminohydroxyphosphoribosylaminopyrimidine deaminase / 5-amino-6-(5-phosphoribosylamino)uracil reductase